MTRNGENLKEVLETNGRPTRDVTRYLVRVETAQVEADTQILEYLNEDVAVYAPPKEGEFPRFPQKRMRGKRKSPRRD